jgi:hypothetical protein
MILWSLLVGVLLVAVLHRLDLAVDPAARSDAGGPEKRADAELRSAGGLGAPSLPEPVQLPVPPAPGLAACTRAQRSTSVTVARQLTRRLLPRILRFTPVRRD